MEKHPLFGLVGNHLLTYNQWRLHAKLQLGTFKSKHKHTNRIKTCSKTKFDFTNCMRGGGYVEMRSEWMSEWVSARAYDLYNWVRGLVGVRGNYMLRGLLHLASHTAIIRCVSTHSFWICCNVVFVLKIYVLGTHCNPYLETHEAMSFIKPTDWEPIPSQPVTKL